MTDLPGPVSISMPYLDLEFVRMVVRSLPPLKMRLANMEGTERVRREEREVGQV